MIVDSALYRAGARVPVDCEPNDYAALRKAAGGDETGPGAFVWVGLHEPDHEEFAAVARAFDLHPLAVEDAIKAHQRPKLEHYGETYFLILKTLWYLDAEDAVETGEINLFVGPDFVVSVRHGEGSQLRTAREFLESDSGVLTHGPSAVLYAICDTVVDAYISVLAELQEDVDEIEEAVFAPERTDTSARIYVLKREIAEARRAVLPLREPMRRFVSGGLSEMDEEGAFYFRDVADHLARAAETVDSLDVLLSSAFEAYLTRISVQQNDDMRKISAGAALVVVPTLIAGIYGMNFDSMPELHWTLGYPFALGLMVAVSAGLWWLFKRSGWL